MSYNPLYDKGFTRVGCIGCPLASNQKKELDMYPKYKQMYKLAFQKMIDKRKKEGKKTDSWQDGESVYKWWIEDKQIDGQLVFDEQGNITEYKP